MKIAYEATALLGRRTGVGEFCFGALEALARVDDLDLNAFALSFRRRHLLKASLPKGAKFADWVMPARPLHALWRHSNFPPIDLWDRHLDVVHGTNFVVPPTFRAAKIVTVHDLTVVRFPQMCNPPTLIYPTMVKRAIAAGASIHTPSRFVANEVVEHFQIDPERVFPIHHGIPEVVQLPSHSGSQIDDLAGKRFILALGTVEPRKDLPLLVDAFGRIANEFDDLLLVIAGQDGWGSDKLLDAISKSRFKSRILRLGYVTPETRTWLLSEASVFAYPSVYEGFGFPPLEAMSVGTPVVSTNAGALAEVLSGDACVLVDAGDRDGFADGISAIVGDGRFARSLRSEGVRHAQTFSWNKCAAELASMYRLARAR